MKKRISVLLALCLLFTAAAPAFAAGLGDVTAPAGTVTAADARAILRAAVGLETLSEEARLTADITMDGAVTAEDARLALRAAVGLELTDGKYYKNQIDVLESGHFYVSVTLLDNAGAAASLTYALTPDSLFLRTTMGDMPVSILKNSEGLYLIDDGDRVYGCLPAALLRESESEDMFDPREFADIDSMFYELSKIDRATKSEAVFEGQPCDCYTLNEPSGVTRIYMRGRQLLATTEESRSGVTLSTCRFDKISPYVPRDAAFAPGGYEEIDPFEFILRFGIEV